MSRTIVAARAAACALVAGATLTGCGKQTASTTPPAPMPQPPSGLPGPNPQPAPNCSTIHPATAPAGSPPDDVLGVRLGMPASLVVAELTCGNSSYVISRNTGVRFNVPSINQGPQPDTSISADAGDDKVEIVLLGMPGQEQAARLAHSTIYPNGKPQPPFAAQRQSLLTKYGQPTSEEKSGQYHDILHWVYEPSGQAMSTKNPSYANCANGGGLGSGFSVDKGCGLTIWAQIETTDSGGVFRVDVSIMNQAAAVAAIKKEEAAIQIQNTPTGTAGRL